MTPREQILDAALELADTRGWEAVRLFDVAMAAGLSLEDIRHQFREKEELADAWFDRADRAMLEDAARPDYLTLTPRERLHRSIMAWLDALAPHRQVTRQIILNKCEPGHLHVQIPGLLRVSRTVQWFREAAHRDAKFVQRAVEESVLTSLYLVTFINWLYDDSENAQRTRQLLDSLLRGAEVLSAWAPGLSGH